MGEEQGQSRRQLLGSIVLYALAPGMLLSPNAEAARSEATIEQEKLLPVIVDIPCWVPSQVDGRYVTKPAGYEAYALGCQTVLVYLMNQADLIELSNEPNFIGGHSTAIPSYHYGKMAAYATVWIRNCFNGTKAPLVGSLLCGPAPPATSSVYQVDGNWWTYMGNFMSSMSEQFLSFYPFATYPLDLLAVNNLWRLSLHPYPRLGSIEGQQKSPGPGCVPPSDPSLRAVWIEKYGRVPLPKADPQNGTGDTTAAMALSSTMNYVSRVLTNYPSRKVWITEVGVSGNKLGRSAQASFCDGICSYVKSAQNGQVEGLTFWPHNDSDWGQIDDQQPWYRMAPVKADYSKYAAGNTTSQRFGLPGL